MQQEKKITEILVITGYLGSGKTTLIQKMLKNTDYKIAVIQNEFSNEMGIEAPIMIDNKGEIFDKFYELPNGCLCCSSKDDLVKAIEYFLESKDYELDYIVIETNGLADPSNTIKTLWADEELEFPANIKSVNAIVDAGRFDSLKHESIFQKQLIYADRIIINKKEKITSDEQREYLLKSIRDLNQIAVLDFTEYAEISLETLFSLQGFIKVNLKSLEKAEYFSYPTEHFHPSKDGVDFVLLDIKGRFDIKKLEMQFGRIFWDKALPCEIMRLKGILRSHDNNNIYSLQGVQDSFEIQDTEIEWGENPYNKILLIGKKIERDAVLSFLEDTIIG